MTISGPPRAQAFERKEALEICNVEGHLPPAVSWYSRDSEVNQPCLRGCGEMVKPTLDMSGHP